jgi:hypothetical protein
VDIHEGDIDRLEPRSRPPYGDARVLVTGRIGFRHPAGSAPGQPSPPYSSLFASCPSAMTRPCAA